MAKRDPNHYIYKSRWHGLVLDQPPAKEPPPLSSFFPRKPRPPIVDQFEHWNGGARNHSNECTENSYRPPKGQGIDLSREPKPVVNRENKLPFRYSKYHLKKDYPPGW